MAFRLSLKSLKKIQPGKLLKKAAKFIPGGSELADTIDSALGAFKKKNKSIASGQAYADTSQVSGGLGNIGGMSGNTLLIGAIVIVLLVVLMKRR
jgi:hypothetical protein